MWIFRDDVFLRTFKTPAQRKRSSLVNCDSHKIRSSSRLKSFCFRARLFPRKYCAQFSGCLPRRVPAFRPAISSAIHLSARAVWKTVRKVLREYLRFGSHRAHDCEFDSRILQFTRQFVVIDIFWQISAPAKARNFGAPSSDSPPNQMWH